MCQWGFSGGPVVETPPANTADMGSILGLGRSHMPGGNQAQVQQWRLSIAKNWINK